MDEERERLPGNGPRPGAPGPGLWGKLLTIVLTAAVLATAFMLSLLVFAVVLTAGVLAWGYLWWKTRGLRQQLRDRPPGGRVIEGEVMREAAPHDETPR